jgi:hypothetical protein
MVLIPARKGIINSKPVNNEEFQVKNKYVQRRTVTRCSTRFHFYPRVSTATAKAYVYAPHAQHALKIATFLPERPEAASIRNF